MLRHLGEIIQTVLLLVLTGICGYSGFRGMRGGSVALPFGGPSPNMPVDPLSDTNRRRVLSGEPARLAGAVFLALAVAFLACAAAIWM